MPLRCVVFEGGLEKGDALGSRRVKRRERRGPWVGARLINVLGEGLCVEDAYRSSGGLFP